MTLADKIKNAKKYLSLKLPIYGIFYYNIDVFEVDNSDEIFDTINKDSNNIDKIISEIKKKQKNKTAYTNGKSIYFYKKFHESLKQNEFNFVYLHEILHIVNLHTFRQEKYKLENHIKFNIAADCVINGMIREYFPIDKTGIHNYVSMPQTMDIGGKLTDTGWYIPEYLGLSTEEVYYKLDENDYYNKNKRNYIGDLSQETLSNEDLKKIRELGIKSKIYGTSKFTDSQLREFDIILKPKINWKRHIKAELNNSISNYNMFRRDRRYIKSDFYIPSMDEDEKIEIAIVIDTSCSITKNEISKFLMEVHSIIENYKNKVIHMFACDDLVRSYSVIKSKNDLLSFEIKGEGGTDFNPPFDMIREKNLNINTLIYFTDGYGSFPTKKVNYKTIWMLTTEPTLINTTFGKKIFYNVN